MGMMLRALIFVLFLHLVSGAKITSIQTFRSLVNARVGHPLVIPCVYNKDEPLRGHKIELEWGMTPKNGGEYRPLIRLSGTMPMPVLHPNQRVRMNPRRLPSGQCALVIDPVKLEDSGTYRIRLTIDGEEYKEAPEVKIHVWEFLRETESSPERFRLSIDQPKKDQSLLANDGVLHTESSPEGLGLSNDQPKKERSLQANGGVHHAEPLPKRSRFFNFNPNGRFSKLRKAKVLQALHDSGIPLWLVIVLGVLIFLLLLFSGPAYYFACKYFLLKYRTKNVSSLMEEGRAPRMAEDNNDNNAPTVLVQ